MTVNVLKNPRSFVQEAKSNNITHDLLQEAIECIGMQKVCRMFKGKSQRGNIDAISAGTMLNWLATFKYSEDHPAENKSEAYQARSIEKNGDEWDEYVKILETKIDDEILDTWNHISLKKLGDEAIKHGFTIGVRNSKARQNLRERLEKMAERRREKFWEKIHTGKDEDEETEEVDEKINYDRINVPTLKQIMKKRGIVSSKLKKAEMIEKLEEYDENIDDIILDVKTNKYENMNCDNLKKLARDRKLTKYNKLNKEALVNLHTEYDETIEQIKEEVKEEIKKEENDTLIFKSELTGNKNIRVFGTNDKPWFVAKDIAEILEYKDSKKAIRDHVHSDDIISWREYRENKGGDLVTLQIHPETKLINEPGLYSLISGSKLEKAVLFRRWVYSEVLPSIRKTGNYKLDNPTRFIIQDDNSVRSQLLGISNMDVESEKLEKDVNLVNYNNLSCVYVAYIGNSLIKIGFSDCILTRERKHMSGESMFPQFRIVKCFEVSGKPIETILHSLLDRYRHVYGKQKEIYKTENLIEFIGIIEKILDENDLKIVVARLRIKVLELENKLLKTELENRDLRSMKKE